MSNFDKLPVEEFLKELKELGFYYAPHKTIISIPDAASVLGRAFKWYFSQPHMEGCEFHKNPAYKEVAEWLANNDGRSLLLYGGCGQGKTLLAKHIIPSILYYYGGHKIVHFFTMCDINDSETLAEAKKYHYIALDDVGIENTIIDYGQRYNAFDEIMDKVEKSGSIAIITTNLTGQEIEQKYGTRTLDRIKATCKRVMFDLRDEKGNPISFRS